MKQIRKPFNIVMALILLIVVTIATIAFSSWLITDEITEKPIYQPGTVAKYYLDNQKDIYDGTSQAPTSPLFAEDELSYQYRKSGDTDYISDKPTNAGIYDIRVTIKENNEKVDVGYQIKPKPFSNDFTVQVKGDKFVHTGTAITPKITLMDGTTTLIEGTDYTLDYENNIALGNATIIITGIGNYEGTLNQEFTIVSTSKLEIVCTNMQQLTYNGKSQLPEYTVKCGSDVIDDAIVEIQYQDPNTGEYIDGQPMHAGVYAIRFIAKKEGYEDSDMLERKVNINPKEITVTWENLNLVYNKTEQRPTAKSSDLEDDGSTLEVTGKQTNAGSYTAKASVDVGHAGDYTIKSGESSSFTIKPLGLSLNNYSIEKGYDSTTRTWGSIQDYISKQLSLNGVLSGDTVSLLIKGMNDGTFGYGSDTSITGINNNDKTGITSYTNVVGSTYLVTVALTGSSAINYTLRTGTPVIFKYKTAIVNGTYYTIEEAITKATGDITFAGDASNATSFVYSAFSNLASSINPYSNNKNEYLISSRKFIVPCSTSVSEKKYSSTAKPGNVYSSVYIPEAIALNFVSSSELLADGVIGFSQPNTTITCTRGVLYNNGYISIANGCSLNAYGYVKGFGTIDLAKGSSAIDCMHTYDWPGGKAGSQMYKKVLPTNAWSVHNISCKVAIYAGAIYKAFVYANGTLPILGLQDIYASAILIGDSQTQNCLFKITSGYAEKIATPAASTQNDKALYLVTGSNQEKGQRDSVKIYGNCEDATLNVALTALGITVNMETSTDKPATVGYMDISVEEGSKFTLTKSDYLFLPGSSLTIKKGATVTIGSNVDVTMATWSEINGLSGGFKNHCKDTVDAKAIVNGAVIVNGSIGGIWESTEESAILNISGGQNTISTYRTMISSDDLYYIQKTLAATGNINGTINSNFSKTVYVSVNNNGTYYWTEATNVTEFTLNFFDGNNLLETKTMLVVDGTSYIITGNEYKPTKKYYDFVKWTIADGTTAVGKVLNNGESINLYANWTLHKYDVIYNITYEDCEDLSTGLINGNFDSFTYDDVVNKLSFVDAIDGTLFFDGWYIDPDCTIKLKNNEITLEEWEKYGSYVEDGLTLYGKFSKNTKYTISFVTNESSMETPNEQVVSSASEVILPDASAFATDKNFTRYLQGWYTTADCQPGTEFSETTLLTSNATLYAKWADKYKITFNVDGTETSSYIMPGDGISDILPNTTKDDTNEGTHYTKWIYLGLSKTKGATSPDVNVDTEIPSGNTTYYAIYSGKNYSKLSITVTAASMTVSYKTYNTDFTSFVTETKALKAGYYEFIVVAGEAISFSSISYDNSKRTLFGDVSDANYIEINGSKHGSGQYKSDIYHYANKSQTIDQQTINTADIVVKLYSSS